MAGVVGEDGGSAEQRRYDAVAAWDTGHGRGPVEVIDAACAARTAAVRRAVWEREPLP
ncbi:hypothetical protein ABZ807_20090 [Micromonospora sp. NPDC047548]|uniref:hypothetical protein n=1 Tax=Micromonospora sp. NPDC047548 TaxID=3155624 RepID=UPI0033F62B6C